MPMPRAQFTTIHPLERVRTGAGPALQDTCRHGHVREETAFPRGDENRIPASRSDEREMNPLVARALILKSLEHDAAHF